MLIALDSTLIALGLKSALKIRYAHHKLRLAIRFALLFFLLE